MLNALLYFQSFVFCSASSSQQDEPLENPKQQKRSRLGPNHAVQKEDKPNHLIISAKQNGPGEDSQSKANLEDKAQHLGSLGKADKDRSNVKDFIDPEATKEDSKKKESDSLDLSLEGIENGLEDIQPGTPRTRQLAARVRKSRDPKLVQTSSYSTLFVKVTGRLFWHSFHAKIKTMIVWTFLKMHLSRIKSKSLMFQTSDQYS